MGLVTSFVETPDIITDVGEKVNEDSEYDNGMECCKQVPLLAYIICNVRKAW